MSTDSKTPVTNAAVRIADYLFSGGLFNPELATHDNVRDLLIDCRTELVAANERIAEQKGLTIMACMNVTELEIRCENLRLKLDSENALQEEINRLTHNQRMQDSITAQVMERAEKAEAEAEVFKSLYLNEQGRCEALRVDAERYRWLRKQGKPTSPESIWFARGVFGFGGISLWCLDRLDEAIDEAMKKTTI